MLLQFQDERDHLAMALMPKAITEYHRVDEVKDIRDKAKALQVYAKQAKNRDAERRAAQVLLRAERRTGELVKDMGQPASVVPRRRYWRKPIQEPGANVV